MGTNDSDPDGEALGFAKLTDPSHGTVTVAANGGYTYTPATGFSGTDSFTYQVTDANGGHATAAVTITVQNATPVTTGLANQTGTDAGAFNFATAGAFSDQNGDTLTFRATGLTAGLNIHPVTGVVSGTIGS